MVVGVFVAYGVGRIPCFCIICLFGVGVGLSVVAPKISGFAIIPVFDWVVGVACAVSVGGNLRGIRVIDEVVSVD